MKFATKEDIEAPIGFVFDEVSDFASLERSALRRGAEVQRTDDLITNGVGMCWDAAFEWRGKQRSTGLELVAYEPPNAMRFASSSASMTGDLWLDLVALSRGRTRLSMEMELRPQNLSARLLIQSLKLARGNIMKRFEQRIATFARDLEDKHKSRG